MAVLENITVVDADLIKICPDIVSSLKFANQANFTDVITDAKKVVFGMIKEKYREDNPGYTDAELNTDLVLVKDRTEEGYLKDKVSKLTIAAIFRQNRMWDEMEVWDEQAKRVPLLFYIDLDEDSTVDLDEEKRVPEFKGFHR